MIEADNMDYTDRADIQMDSWTDMKILDYNSYESNKMVTDT